MKFQLVETGSQIDRIWGTNPLEPIRRRGLQLRDLFYQRQSAGRGNGQLVGDSPDLGLGFVRGQGAQFRDLQSAVRSRRWRSSSTPTGSVSSNSITSSSAAMPKASAEEKLSLGFG
ncbi:MAG: hypothetical protein MUE50_07975 [Pirellulaceae bacterium]|nr:hypothetical protein [Pirellulaceae bacterium]